jgi:hypothetical protein
MEQLIFSSQYLCGAVVYERERENDEFWVLFNYKKRRTLIFNAIEYFKVFIW